MMSKDDSIPKASPLYTEDFTKMYQKLYNEGCTDIIVVLINSKGSETFNNSIKAKENFYSKYPNANVKIHSIVEDWFKKCAIYYARIGCVVSANIGADMVGVIARRR